MSPTCPHNRVAASRTASERPSDVREVSSHVSGGWRDKSSPRDTDPEEFRAGAKKLVPELPR